MLSVFHRIAVVTMKPIDLMVCALALLLCVNTTERVAAQLITADIVGTITDPAGAVVANANVKAHNTATNEERTARSTTSGDFVINLLPPGQYTVTVEAPRFKKSVDQCDAGRR